MKKNTRFAFNAYLQQLARLIGVLMLAINWYYKHKAYQLLRDGQISREDYESINR